MDHEQKHVFSDTPESSHDELPAPVTSVPPTSKKMLRHGGIFRRMQHWLNERLSRRQFVIASVVFIALFGGALAFALSNKAAAPKPAFVTKHTQPKPTPVAITSPLTGMQVSATDTKRPVTAAMIENSDWARPQAGLKEAGVVFEAIAEAGITRFMALYQEAQPANLGPIRSVRPYYLQWALGFDAAVSHVGGSPEALNDVKAWNVKDLNQFYYGSYYHRISSREAPHNVYTSIANLNTIETQKGWTTSTFTGFPRKNDAPSKTPDATSIDFAISSSDYFVHYDYDAAQNSYLRFEGGAKHLDATSGQQLEPKVVIAIVVPYSIESDNYHSDYGVIGSGKAYVFQDGTVASGTWSKAGSTDQIQFLDANNNPIKLNAGQTWISAVATANEVNYK